VTVRPAVGWLQPIIVGVLVSWGLRPLRVIGLGGEAVPEGGDGEVIHCITEVSQAGMFGWLKGAPTWNRGPTELHPPHYGLRLVHTTKSHNFSSQRNILSCTWK
jgi:hypothetical protein